MAYIFIRFCRFVIEKRLIMTFESYLNMNIYDLISIIHMTIYDLKNRFKKLMIRRHF